MQILVTLCGCAASKAKQVHGISAGCLDNALPGLKEAPEQGAELQALIGAVSEVVLYLGHLGNEIDADLIWHVDLEDKPAEGRRGSRAGRTGQEKRRQIG